MLVEFLLARVTLVSAFGVLLARMLPLGCCLQLARLLRT